MKVRQSLAVAFSSLLAFSLVVALRPEMARAAGDTLYVGFGVSGGNTGCSDPDYGVATLGVNNAIYEALTAANDGDTVYLCAGTYELTSTIQVQSSMANDITIRGAGVKNTILDGGGDTRILRDRASDTDLKIMDLTFFNGFDSRDGGAICHDDGDLLVQRVTFTDNVSDGYGGAIACYGESLTILDSRFINNSARWHGGAIDVHQRYGTVIQNSSFANNHAGEEGGALGCNGSDLTVTRSQFIGNTSDAVGGAIWYTRNNERLVLQRNTFIRNVSAGVGGAIVVGDTPLMRGVGRQLLRTNSFSGNRAAPMRSATVGYRIGGGD